MTAMYVGMAGSGESYRIERVYRNADRGVWVRRGLPRLRWWSRFVQQMERNRHGGSTLPL